MTDNKKKREKDKQTLDTKEKLVNMLDLPRDVMLNVPIMNVEGKNLLHIENYKGIIEYNDELIRLSTAIGVLRITGKSLLLKSITSEDIIINGFIKTITFV